MARGRTRRSYASFPECLKTDTRKGLVSVGDSMKASATALDQPYSVAGFDMVTAVVDAHVHVPRGRFVGGMHAHGDGALVVAEEPGPGLNRSE